jgi:hypothetical protein
MSEPTYRITTEYDPSEADGVAWEARIVRLSDGQKIRSVWGATEELTLEAASVYLERLNRPQQAGHVYFANEDGSLA